MGGYGSGRHPGRIKVESCRSLDVNRLHREGCLRVGWAVSWQWTCDGEPVAWIRLRAEHDRLHLNYRVCAYDGDWQDVAETVSIARAPCRFGGTRPYFRCPGIRNGIACERRVQKLYAPGRYFRCRHCCRLSHSSQSEDFGDRAQRRADKIRQRLGGEPGWDAPLPQKPRGMWNRTYARLCEKLDEAESLADRAFAIRAAGLLERFRRAAR